LPHMMRCRASPLFLVVFLMFIVCNLSSENAKADNASKYTNLTKEIRCDEKLVNENEVERDEEMYINTSYDCDNTNAVFSLPNYTRDYTLKSAVNEMGVLSITVTPYKSKSILVIKIRSSDKPFDNAPVLIERDLDYFLQDYYPSSTSSPHHRQIDTCDGTIKEGTTEELGRSVFGAIYDHDPLCNSSKTFRRVSIKTIMNARDFDEFVKTFKLMDKRCD
jgi:hypothetical protein